jgi:hypothetical protein
VTKILHIISVAAILAILVFGVAVQNNIANADISTWQKGVTFYPMWNGDFGSDQFKLSLQNAASTHINYATLVIPLYQSNLFSTDVQTGGNTPTDAALISAITYAHSIGLHVMLKPHVDSFTGEWRANINPSDRNAWFTNYTNLLVHYAKIGAQFNVEDFAVGTELINMSSASANSSNTANWQNLISTVRQNFPGKLTYSANWGPAGWTDEKNSIQFWSSLDYIGISAYFNLSGDGSVASLENSWSGINNSDITPLSQRWGKPVVFTEIGYLSVSGSYTQPWNFSFGGPVDGQSQANDYQAVFDYWSRQNFMQGVEMWNWNTDPNAGGSGDTNYTPQNKPAQATMTTWFAGTPQAPIGNPNFVTSSSANPNPIVAGQAVNIVSNVTNNGSPVGNIIVDVEVYNASGQKIFQNFSASQDFPQGQLRTYNTGWTPPSSGTYTVKIGIFNFNWSQNYLWVDNAETLSTNGNNNPPPSPNPPPTNPPPVSTALDIWWPTSGSSIGGTNVPFKAMLENTDVPTYDMYWQVDNGALVFMPTNITDYPHKEFDVDLTSWTWNSSGIYNINFVAKDKSGNIITQKAVSVSVVH